MLQTEEVEEAIIDIDKNADDLNKLAVDVVICRNAACRKATITAVLKKWDPFTARLQFVQRFSLFPGLIAAKPQPAYIPKPIVADYREACLIVDLSPKASATLSRRCLQGMIRNFHGVAKPRLIDEINAIKDLIPLDVWTTIDAVRKIGNIGAHMEKDINVIVDVDENEARLLIELIEQLFEEWYVTRHNRQERMKAITDAAAEKREQKKAPPAD